MKIIIEVKDTATLSRIKELSQTLDALKNLTEVKTTQIGFADVIKSISKEW